MRWTRKLGQLSVTVERTTCVVRASKTRDVLINAANEARPLPWDNVEPWIQDAVAMERLQPDGTLTADVLKPEDTLGAWSHQVWVVRR